MVKIFEEGKDDNDGINKISGKLDKIKHALYCIACLLFVLIILTLIPYYWAH